MRLMGDNKVQNLMRSVLAKPRDNLERLVSGAIGATSAAWVLPVTVWGWAAFAGQMAWCGSCLSAYAF